MQIGSAEHYRWLKGIVASIVVLNLLDACLTLVWLTSGAATEANPLMETLLHLGPLPFVLGKIALVSGGAYLLWTARRHALAVVATFVTFLAYYFVFLYHLTGLKAQMLAGQGG